MIIIGWIGHVHTDMRTMRRVEGEQERKASDKARRREMLTEREREREIWQMRRHTTVCEPKVSNLRSVLRQL